MKKTKIFGLLFAFVLPLLVAVAFITTEAEAWPSQIDTAVEVDTPAQVPSIGFSDSNNVVAKSVDETHVYIVVLEDTPLASYRGDIPGLTATNPQARGQNKLDAKAPESVAYLDYLAAQRTNVIEQMNDELGRSAAIGYQYGATVVGFSVELSAAEVAQVEQLPGVLFVEREKISYIQTDAGPRWIEADTIWDGSATGVATYGEGVIVGVIDTGVDPWNPSFADIGGDGYDHTNPYGDDVYVGVCDPANAGGGGVVAYDPTFPCNDKLIGVWGYTASDPNPRDSDGHGSHTSSTSAGNFVFGAVITTPTDVYTADISGVAPHANLIVYDGCADSGGCPGAALGAARDQALLDGVDVINYSIGSSAPTGNPWGDVESIQWLALRDAGVFVATSAGNAGPGDATLGSPGDIPWITTVGASSHDRTFLNSLVVTDSVSSLTLNGVGITGPLTETVEVVLSKWYTLNGTIAFDDARLCADGIFPPGTFDGEIVVCERGGYGRVAKGQTVKDGGAGGYVLAQAAEVGGGPGATVADPHVLPGVHIDYTTYQDLLTFMMNAGDNISGTISGAVLDIQDANGDVMGSFSSRGPNRSLGDLISPNVTAPGRAIWAAYGQGPNGDGDYTFNVIQGTSMSSPHVAGAGALMKALYPDWSVAEIESALMTTADTTVLDDDGVSDATPFAMGAGRIDLSLAANAGLVLDVTNQEYLDADPTVGGSPRDLNRAALGEDTCIVVCEWTRVLSSTQNVTVTWAATTSATQVFNGGSLVLSVEPALFDIAPYDTQVVTITADVSSLPEGEWAFGEVRFSEVSSPTRIGAGLPDAHLPVAVSPATGDVPTFVVIETDMDSGSHDVPDIISVEVVTLTTSVYGLDFATIVTDSLSQDPTRGDPYDNLNDGTTFYVTTTVLSGTLRFIAETTESEASDIDLYVGTGSTPSAATEVCNSTTPTEIEYCEIDDPAPGTWWILVQNWEESGDPPDHVTLAYGTVTMSDAGNMSITGPASVPAGTPFTVTINYSDSMQIGDVLYGAFILGSQPSSPDDIGMIDVNLYRVGTPDISIAPDSLESTQSVGELVTLPLTITNSGDDTLDWFFNEAPPPSDVPADLDNVLRSTTSATAAAAKVTSGGVVDDGSFEGGSPNPFWNEGGSIASPICDPSCGADLARTGSWYVWMGGWATDNTAFVDQDVTIPADPNGAVLRFWMLIGADPTVDSGTLDVSIDGNVVASFSEQDAPNFGEYTEVVVDISAYADGGVHNLEFFGEEVGTTITNFFVDDVSITAGQPSVCDTPGNIPWVSVDPGSGSTAPAGMSVVDVIFDSTELDGGTYTGYLCLESNDPATPQYEIPLTVTVQSPVISVEPMSFAVSASLDSMVTQTLTISNSGNGDLNWHIDELAPTVVLDLATGQDVAPVADNNVDSALLALSNAPADVPSAAALEANGDAIILVLDDGTRDNAIGLTNGGEFIWANQFTPAPGEYPFFLQEVHILFPNGTGVDVGEIVDIFVYEVPSGNPALGATHKGSIVNAAVQANDDTTFSIYTFDEPVLFTGPGDVLISVVNRTAGLNAGEFSASIDQTVSQGRSWIGAYNESPIPVPPQIPPSAFWAVVDTVNPNLAGNWMVRGLGTPATGCDSPSDISWASVMPVSGTVAAGSSEDVYVMFDATGLSVGVYTGTLCLRNNDPIMPLVEVPLTFDVFDPDNDDDSIDDDIEDDAPNDGDGNDDGVMDSTQSNVASLPGQNDGAYVTIETSDGNFTQVTNSPAPKELPDDVTSFPEGVMDFTITNVVTGSTVVVTLTLHSGIEPDSYWKWDGSEWYEYEGAVIMAHPSLADTYVVELTLTDGGDGDLDGEENGVIVDPSAPAFGGLFRIYAPMIFKDATP